jgi:hypothetical protein
LQNLRALPRARLSLDAFLHKLEECAAGLSCGLRKYDPSTPARKVFFSSGGRFETGSTKRVDDTNKCVQELF